MIEVTYSDEFFHYKRKHGDGRLPATYVNAHWLWRRYAPEYALSEQPPAMTEQAADKCRALLREMYSRVEVPFGQYDSRLTSPQATGVAELLARKRMILADGMGSGKTVQACEALNQLLSRTGSLKALVVCPLTVVNVWVRHIREWVGFEPAVIRYKGDKLPAYTENFICIVPWTSLATHSELAYWRGGAKSTGPKQLNIDWDVVIADEAHKAKNPAAMRSRALASLRSEYLWLLTGTPAANTPVDLWSLLRLVDPLSWRSKSRFIDEWCETERNYFGGGLTVTGMKRSELSAFKEILRPVMLQRDRTDVRGREIEVVRDTVYVEMLPSQRRIYESLIAKWRAEISGGQLTIHSALAMSSQLYQVTQSTVELVDGRLEMRTPSPKIDALMDIVDGTDEQVVAYSPSRKLISLARSSLRAATTGMLTGQQSLEARQKAIDAFQDGKSKVLLATTQVASEGIDLTAAGVVANISGTWSIIDKQQSEARVVRTGQTKTVYVVDVVCKDSIDERVHEVMTQKENLQKSLDMRKIMLKELE